MKRILLAAATLIAIAGSAQAYTAYVKPADFWPDTNSVAIESAFATTFFSPEIALGGTFVLLEPDGSPGVFDQIEITGTAALLTAAVGEGGTYRISTGEVLGQVGTIVGIDGAWRPLPAGATAPEGAPVTTIQAVTVADTYVTRGAPTRTVVDHAIGRLVLRPVIHPNQILVNQAFQVQALFDGAAHANAALVIYRDGEPETNQTRFVATDAEGNATILIDTPGNYVLAARHVADAPAGSASAVQSYTTTLVFEVLTELPPIVDIQAEAEEEEERQRPPRRRPPRDPRVGRY
ncbi:MAG: DUF4198 domain-containing protein [Hyphomonadaceae bacterium]|nr:DUF4198 domain-containing protein [Hyphomonadaceae bacterium]